MQAEQETVGTSEVKEVVGWNLRVMVGSLNKQTFPDVIEVVRHGRVRQYRANPRVFDRREEK
jgi:hypothetical protein